MIGGDLAVAKKWPGRDRWKPCALKMATLNLRLVQRVPVHEPGDKRKAPFPAADTRTAKEFAKSA
jgi:hypothetical protein